jgi:hypothetical protein
MVDLNIKFNLAGIQTHDSADENRNLHDSGIAETELWTMSSEIHCDVRIHH